MSNDPYNPYRQFPGPNPYQQPPPPPANRHQGTQPLFSSQAKLTKTVQEYLTEFSRMTSDPFESLVAYVCTPVTDRGGKLWRVEKEVGQMKYIVTVPGKFRRSMFAIFKTPYPYCFLFTITLLQDRMGGFYIRLNAERNGEENLPLTVRVSFLQSMIRDKYARLEPTRVYIP